MATKGKGGEPQEPEAEFVPPEFDEKEYIYKDLYGTKVTIICAVLAVIVGICAGCITNMWSWLGGLLLLVVVLLGMKQFLTLLRFDAELVETKTMLGNYILYILLALGVWTLMVNPPFV